MIPATLIFGGSEEAQHAAAQLSAEGRAELERIARELAVMQQRATDIIVREGLQMTKTEQGERRARAAIQSWFNGLCFAEVRRIIQEQQASTNEGGG
ncbi:MAG TPA: hypothetical protein VF528_09795 [Pyrinomonadaceae bacterium]|jgi:hypothetical protein